MEVYNGGKPVASFEEYIKAIESINKSKHIFKEFIFRGQADESWLLNSGIHRRLMAAKKLIGQKEPQVEIEEIQEYLKERIREVRKREASHPVIRGMNELNLLAEMQHYGTATNLIDFSHSSLIALYMACDDGNKTNGKVFCINYKNAELFNDASILLDKGNGNWSGGVSILDDLDDKIYSFSPWHSNSRIIKQESIFLFNKKGIIEDDNIDHVILIAEGKKIEILETLAKIAGITEETIYPDFLGYLQANASKKAPKLFTAEDYLKIAADFRLNGKNKEAVGYYEKALKIKPKNDTAWYNLGNIYSFLKDKSKAVKCYIEAIKIKPDLDMAWNNMGNAYDDLGQKEKAIECYEKAIRIRPDYDLAWNNIGFVYNSLGQKDKAIKCYEKAIKIKPDYDIAWNNLGVVYKSLGQKEKALKCYEKAVKIKPSYDMAWNNLGNTYIELGSTEKAIECFKKALEFNSTKYGFLKEKIAKLAANQQ